jgi:hypothetical protein
LVPKELPICCLDVVIVNWNAGDQLRQAVSSIAAHGHGIVDSVVIVDNASTDGSLTGIESMIPMPSPKVKIARNEKNMGFAAACNQGAALSSGEFILFLNPDAKLFADSLAISVTFMRQPENDDVGICGIQLLDESGHVSRSCARFPSVNGFLAHAVGLDRVFPRWGHFMAEWDHAQTRDVDHVIGAFFLVRRAMFEALGGFDERFFVYLEDLDFSRRARNAGWRTVYLADAQAFHAGGGTSRQVKARRLFYALRSRLLYAFKHFSRAGALSVMLVTLLVEPFPRSVMALLRGSWSGLKETWSAYGMLWRWLPQGLSGGMTR